MRVIIHGCNGRMGRMISELASRYGNFEIVAGVDVCAEARFSYPVYEKLWDVKEEADVIIDISTASAMPSLIEYMAEKKLAGVICTTGLSDEVEEKINRLSETVPVLRSGNMSMGINTILKVLREISPALTEAGFDVEIVEKHHKTKIDAPSGTAVMLADAVREGTGTGYAYVYGRHERRMERPANEIGISSVRGGTIAGEHEVIFAGTDELIEIKHTALSRAVFANGAINAAIFLAGKAPGKYSMADVI